MNISKWALLLISPFFFLAVNDAVTAEQDAGTFAQNADEKEMKWEGKWNNRKFGTSGPLVCTVTKTDEKNWEATFSGVGIGKPFKYEAKFATAKKGTQTLIQGTSVIDGDMYQWTGAIRGKTLVGRYRSASGNNGEFQLAEPDSK